MKTIIYLSVLAFVWGATAAPCLALMSIDEVSRDRAKQLGIQVRTNPAGPDMVRVTLAFDPKGDLNRFKRVDLEIRDGGKLLLSSSLLPEESAKPGHIVVGFAADRGQLEKITLRVVTGASRDLVGHDLRMKDFVDPAKSR